MKRRRSKNFITATMKAYSRRRGNASFEAWLRWRSRKNFRLLGVEYSEKVAGIKLEENWTGKQGPAEPEMIVNIGRDRRREWSWEPTQLSMFL